MTTPHVLLLASAGTGKTYRLATHFAALLAGGVEPARILATTFTRKAAGEILDRVLARLVLAAREGAEGERARRALAAAAESLLGVQRDASRESAEARLATLVRRIGRFQVRTLDSFFVEVARLFAHELGLTPEWHIADDAEDDELRADALSQLIAELDPAARLALLQAIARTGAPTASHSALARSVDEALALHRDAATGAWRRVTPAAHPPEEALRDALAAVLALEVPRNKKGEPNANWVKVKKRLAEVVHARDWAAWIGHTLPVNARSGQGRYCQVPIPDDLTRALRVVDCEAAAALTTALVASNHATGILCDLFVAEERRLKDRVGAYRFDDFPRALAAGPPGADDAEARALWRADLAYRLDARFAHVLLDEFQDTAPLQWRLLLPVVEELLAGAGAGDDPRTFFCVGDVKQSIYGWREAEPRLLGGMHERHPVLVPEELSDSWRSSDVVLGAVNRLFEGLAGREVFAGDEREALRARAAEWTLGFNAHRRASGAGPCAGAVVLLEAARRGARGKSDACLEVAARRVGDLVARVPEATVGVLLRSKKGIPRLLYRLRELGVAASGEGGNPLTDAALVTQALAALHLADHPDDGVAALSVIHSPFARALGLEGVTWDDPGGRARLHVAARETRRALFEDGYGPTLERLGRAATGEVSAWDRARYAQLVELALGYDARAGSRPTAFAAVVRRTRVESPSGARVRVMTVHASKGLEFDAVLLPDLDGQLTGRTPRILARRGGPLEPTPALSIAPAKPLRGLHDEIRELWDATEARALVDELSVLYVAVTRAIHHLELIVPACSKTQPKAPPKTAAALVREAFCGTWWLEPAGGAADDEDSEGGDRTVTEGEEGAAARAEPVTSRERWGHVNNDLSWRPRREERRGRVAPAPRALALAAAPSPRVAAVRAPSAHGVSGGRGAGAAWLAAPERGARDHGTLVHRLFEGLRWVEDEARGEADLAASVRELTPDPAAASRAIAAFRAALAHAPVRRALSRESLAPGEDAEVVLERVFEVEAHDDEGGQGVWRGAIDRVVLVRRGGALLRAEVLDFKTDDVAPDSAEAYAARYRPQLAAYRAAVVEMYGLASEAVRATLVFVTPGVVVDLA